MSWQVGGPSSTPPPSPILRTSFWIALIAGVIAALALTPAVFEETYNVWGLSSVMEENYGDTWLATLVQWIFGLAVFALIVLATVLVWQVLHLLGVLGFVKFFERR